MKGAPDTPIPSAPTRCALLSSVWPLDCPVRAGHDEGRPRHPVLRVPPHLLHAAQPAQVRQLTDEFGCFIKFSTKWFDDPLFLGCVGPGRSTHLIYSMLLNLLKWVTCLLSIRCWGLFVALVLSGAAASPAPCSSTCSSVAFATPLFNTCLVLAWLCWHWPERPPCPLHAAQPARVIQLLMNLLD